MTHGRIAIFAGAHRPFDWADYPVPRPSGDQVVVRLGVATICGADLRQWLGEPNDIAAPGGARRVLGHEMVGRVHDSAAGAAGSLRDGDRVVFRFLAPCGRCRACRRGITRACANAHVHRDRAVEEPPHFHGTFADFVVLPSAAEVMRVPDGLDDRAVAGVNCALAQVVAGLRQADITSGDRVVIQGAGAHGVSAAAVAREMGAAFVVSIDGVAERLVVARAFGADQTVNFRDFASHAGLVAHVRELCGGDGADAVVDLAGDLGAVAAGIAMVAPGGSYIEIGQLRSGARVEIEPAHLKMQNVSVHGVSYYERDDLSWALEFLVRTRERYNWSSLIRQTYPLARIDDAFARAAQRDLTRVAITAE